MSDIKISRYLRSVFQSPSDGCYWFGYYNYDPLNLDGSKALCNRASFDATPIRHGMEVEVGYFDLQSGKWHGTGRSDSFNWQQGAMLQWLPSDSGESKFIYNCSRDGRIVSRIHDLSNGESHDLDYPIYGITPDGSKSISLNMERAYWCRAYHYQSVSNKKYDVAVADDDGVYEIDLSRNTCRCIVSIHQVIGTAPHILMEGARHWLEHIMISPGGRRFCFLHRFSRGDIYDYHTRLFVADIDGSNLQMIEGWTEYRWSHFGWASDDSFVIYSYEHHVSGPNSGDSPTPAPTAGKSVSQSLHNAAKGIYHALVPQHIRINLSRRRTGMTQYYQYYTCREDGIFEKSEEWKFPEFDIDGHPSFTSDSRYMLTDSYPDWRGMQRLLAYDTETHRIVKLGSVRDALTKRPGSCDLHPKLSRDNRHLCIDTAYDGRHHFMVFELDWDTLKPVLNQQ